MLMALRRPDESYSDVILRLVELGVERNKCSLRLMGQETRDYRQVTRAAG